MICTWRSPNRTQEPPFSQSGIFTPNFASGPVISKLLIKAGGLIFNVRFHKD